MRRWRIQGTVHSHPFNMYGCVLLLHFLYTLCHSGRSPDVYGSEEEVIDQDLS